ncbi:hypothetical protein [Pseudomonas gingeri]|uniref:Uncharacterized protein n=1 Tax=Pseudomonas gingeri TaxID=117681 RepID=A0A7Y7WGI7_9PSED|nr:hypothetical protein [Pseudomonas gingeri]NWB48786.1 hypothetical protein [Pseudomonas gingeri]
MNDEIITPAIRFFEDAMEKSGHSAEDLYPRASVRYIEAISAALIETINNEEVKRNCAMLVENGLNAIGEIKESFPEAASSSEFAAYCFVSLAHCLFYDRTFKDHNDQTKKIGSIVAINRAKQADIERARAKAAELWQADAAQEYRITDMAREVMDILKREGVTNLPAIERVKAWIRPVAPSYAKLGGKRKTP